jgi:polyhydroxybutyrate depolymerase
VKTLRALLTVLIAGVVLGGAGWAVGRAFPEHAHPLITEHAHSLIRPRVASPSATGAGQGTGGLEQATLTSDGLVRSYLLYVPPGDSARHRLPLVLVYHGAGETAMDPVEQTGLLRFAEQHHNMILAFLQGYEDTWNDDAGDPPAEAAGINDIEFTKLVLRTLESSYYVDMGSVVATGISNGAIFTELLGCRLAPNLTLVVPVEGQLSVSFSSTCRPGRPISVYEVHGTADPSIPYMGGQFYGSGGPLTVLSAPASAKRWATLNHCRLNGSNSHSGNSVLTKYKACRDAVTVTLQTVRGGVHVWQPNFATTLVRAITSLAGKRQATRP